MKIPVFKQLSENKEFFYAVALILFIPTAFIVNTTLIVRGLNETFDTELTSKANLATSIIGSTLKDSLGDEAKIKNTVTEITNNAPEIEGLTVLSFEEGEAKVFASNEGGEALSTESLLLTKLAWTTGQPYTTRLRVLNAEGKTTRVWQVSLPIIGTNEKTKEGTKDKSEVLGVVNLKVSGEKTDILIDKLERDAVVFTIITLIVVVLLLLNHFRFFGYARLFQRLKEVDEMKDNFISLASHELRTPITALRGYSALAIKNLQKGNSQGAMEDMSKVSISAEGINNLVNDLLDVSRIEQKRLTLEIKKVDVIQSIIEVVKELKVQADQKKLALNYYKPTTPVIISADPQKLKQILVNLIGNSIKYTPAGSVNVSHKFTKNEIIILIEDTGIGIPAEELTNLFGKFHRIRNEQTEKIHGTGLGLWITKQLVEIMKGKISVESIENRGTKFSVRFPLTNL